MSMIIVYHCTDFIQNFCSTQLTVIDGKLFSSTKGEITFFVEIKSCFEKYEKIQSSPLLNLFPKMATLRNKQNLEAMSGETQECPGNNQ